MVKKAGCIVLSKDNPNMIMMIYREKQNDFTFPKGHLESGESLEGCAIKEVREETGLDIKIIKQLWVMEYRDSSQKDVTTVYYLATSVDDQKAKPEKDCSIEWVDIFKVKDKISYENLKNFYVDNIEKIQNN